MQTNTTLLSNALGLLHNLLNAAWCLLLLAASSVHVPQLTTSSSTLQALIIKCGYSTYSFQHHEQHKQMASFSLECCQLSYPQPLPQTSNAHLVLSPPLLHLLQDSRRAA